MRRSAVIPVLAIAICVVASACTHTTSVKRTAIIPAAYLPSRTGEPLDDLQVRIQGEANPVRMSDGSDPIATAVHDTVTTGDPGLLIPQAELGASVYFAPIRYIEIGGQFHWASYRWMRANKAGVLDFPEGRERDLWQGGFGLRGNVPFRRIDLTLSPILEINFVRVPEAEFVDSSILHPGQGYPPGYRFSRIFTTTWVYPAFFVQLDKGFLGSTLHLHFLVGLERTLENVGFDWEQRGESSVEGALAIPIGIGLEYRYGSMVLGATFFYPVALGWEMESATFGPSLALRLGVVLGGRDGKKAPADVPEPAPRKRPEVPAREGEGGVDPPFERRPPDTQQ